jgi:hypothetical protein
MLFQKDSNSPPRRVGRLSHSPRVNIRGDLICASLARCCRALQVPWVLHTFHCNHRADELSGLCMRGAWGPGRSGLNTVKRKDGPSRPREGEERGEGRGRRGASNSQPVEAVSVDVALPILRSLDDQVVSVPEYCNRATNAQGSRMHCHCDEFPFLQRLDRLCRLYPEWQSLSLIPPSTVLCEKCWGDLLLKGGRVIKVGRQLILQLGALQSRRYDGG